MKKTWAQKIEDKATLPKVLPLEKRFPCYNAMRKMGANDGDAIVLVNPSEILPLMAKVPKGKVITLREICRKIAQDHHVQGCCSLTTGIFIMSIANAVEEARAKGAKTGIAEVPYWRTLKMEGFLNGKYPGGLEAHKKLLEKEGFKVIARGKNYQVADFEGHLASV